MTGQLGNIAILGSTGSIGQQTLSIIRENRDRFRVTALAARSDIELLENQAREFEPDFIAVADEPSAAALKRALGSRFEIGAGPQAVSYAASLSSVHTVVGAIVGFSCLSPVLAAINAGKHIALANKESLVAGGELLRQELSASSSVIVPVDSEHNSIFQCLRGRDDNDLRRIILTASGGPFFGMELADLADVSPEDAVKHPRWEMGAKISVDSATLMNKGLEVIEAARLFNLPAEQIGVLIHPQSVLHGLVEYHDGSVSAILSETDMRAPISYALGFLFSDDPANTPGLRLERNGVRALNLAEKQCLEFFEPDRVQFPALDLCFAALKKGGNAPIVLNAANEVAVESFLERKLSFTDVTRVVESVVNEQGHGTSSSVEEILDVDRRARKRATERSGR